MDRRNRGEVLFAALQYAKLDRQAMASGTSGKDRQDALADIEAFKRVQIELFGTSRSAFDAELEECKAVGLIDIRKYIESEG